MPQQEQEIPFPGEVPPESYIGTPFQPPPRQLPAKKSATELRDQAKPPVAKPPAARPADTRLSGLQGAIPFDAGIRARTPADDYRQRLDAADAFLRRIRGSAAAVSPPVPAPAPVPAAQATPSTFNQRLRDLFAAWERVAAPHWYIPEPRTFAVGGGAILGGAGSAIAGLPTGPVDVLVGLGGAGAGAAAGGAAYNRFMGRSSTLGGAAMDAITGVTQEFGGKYFGQLGKPIAKYGKVVAEGEWLLSVLAGMTGDIVAEYLGAGKGMGKAVEIGVGSLTKIALHVMGSPEFQALSPEAKAAFTAFIKSPLAQEMIRTAGRAAGNVAPRVGATAVKTGEKIEKALEPQDTTAGPYWQWHYAKPNNDGGFVTHLTPPEERQFRQWVKENDIPFDSGPTSDYDMRGFWRSGGTFEVGPDGNLRFPQQWKTPYNPSFNRKSNYALPNAPELNAEGQVIDDRGRVLFRPGKKPEPKAAEPPSKQGTSEPTPQVTGPPAGSLPDDFIFRFAGAIARHEGFQKPGSSAQRMNNPGAVQPGGQFPKYPTTDEGWYALYDTIRRDYRPGQTLQDFAHIYDPDDEEAWAKDVGKILGITPETPLADMMPNATNTR